MLRSFVRHSVAQYVNEQATTSGMESFWAMMKRGLYGTYHRMSPAHLQRSSMSSPAATTSGDSTRNSR